MTPREALIADIRALRGELAQLGTEVAEMRAVHVPALCGYCVADCAIAWLVREIERMQATTSPSDHPATLSQP